MKDVFIILIFFTINFSIFAQDKLYYCSRKFQEGSWQVYRKDLKSGNIDTITNNPSFNYWWVTLSEDKRKLLMLRSPVSSQRDQFDYVNCEMIKADADGKNTQVILEDNQYDWYAFGNPHWHPAGDRIIMTAQPNNNSAPFYLVTVDADGNNPTILTANYGIDPNWSPKGDKIVFIGIDSNGFKDLSSFEVFIADYNYGANSLSAVKQLTRDSTRDHDPCFLPDGNKIAFSASNLNLTNADIVTINTTGNQRTNVVDDNGIHGGPINWGSNDKIYHHSIYLGVTNFTVDAFDHNKYAYEKILVSPSAEYISPYYVDLTVMSINENHPEDDSFILLPNPVSCGDFLTLSKCLNKATITIFNSVGQQIQQYENISTDIIHLKCDVFKPGVYFINIAIEGEEKFNKVHSVTIW